MRGISVFLVLFTLAFTTGWSSSGSLPFIQCFILFSQFILVCFIVCKNEIMILWPPWVRVWGWASYWFLPFTVFSLGLPFCFSSYVVHLWCTSEGGSLDVYMTSHSFFVWGSLWVSVALLCCCHCWVGCIVYWRVLCESSLCPVARWHYLPPLSFQKVLFSLSFLLLFHHAFFLFYLWFIGHFIPACWLAWLGQPFCISLVVCICLHPDALL